MTKATVMSRKFDVVIGNLPYEEGAQERDTPSTTSSWTRPTP